MDNLTITSLGEADAEIFTCLGVLESIESHYEDWYYDDYDKCWENRYLGVWVETEFSWFRRSFSIFAKDAPSPSKCSRIGWVPKKEFKAALKAGREAHEGRRRQAAYATLKKRMLGG